MTRLRTIIPSVSLFVAFVAAPLGTADDGNSDGAERDRTNSAQEPPQLEAMCQFTEIPEGRVLLQICEGLPADDRWPERAEDWPSETIRWLGDEFLLPRLPLQFDDVGIRDGWEAPLLLRMAADVDLPVGEQRFLVRARALGRLWVDGQLVANTEPITEKPPDGEERMRPVAKPPLPGHRPPGYRQQEVFGEALIEPDSEEGESDSGDATRRCRVILELVVGADDRRTETGEVGVALFSPDGESISTLGANSHRLPLTDEATATALQRIEASLVSFDDNRRRQAAASMDRYWHQRHEFAREWVRQNQRADAASTVPRVSGAQPPQPIDAFVLAKIERARGDAAATDAEAAEYRDTVLPILRENCFRCHGEKDQGGLTIDTRAGALAGGDSGTPAIVPGDPDGSELLDRVRTDDEGLRMPPTGDRLSGEQIAAIEQWVESGALWPASSSTDADLALAPLVEDAAFLRRLYLDTVGVPPTVAEVESFFSAPEEERRAALIHELVRDERVADHWMSFWLDLLAENPSLLNASLNSTGPFRWFLYDSLRDNKPLDRMVTELLMMRGGAAEGGSAGFELAGENDAPFAAKGHIVASGFLGIDLQCARCHDSPYHSTTQQDLYSLAAMLERKPVTVPETSQVPAAFFEAQQSRESLIRATLDPDDAVSPEWPFAEVTGVTDGPSIEQLMRRPDDARERLATLITAPQNERFSRVIVNRIWKRLVGAGLVEPADDWEGNAASHPELLDWLARDLVVHDYDLRHLIRRIVSSETYQRAATGNNLEASPAERFFAAPERRRLSAEQVVDSLHVTTGHPIDVEELTFVHDGRRPLGKRQTLGRPSRAWMFGDLKNERDRPSLSLPRARAVVDVLEAFGWTGARQRPITDRETDPNVLQPGILANGTLSVTLTRASAGSDLAELAIASPSPEQLVETLFLRALTRKPKPEEGEAFTAALAEGFESRLVPPEQVSWPSPPQRLPKVTWFNHLRPKANEIQQQLERRVRQGPPPDPRLRAEWREVYEDAIWSLINHREFIWIP